MPLVEFHDDDWLRQELPELFGHVGQAALAPLHAYLADRSRSAWGHSLVARALGAVAQQHPELHDAVVPILSDVLRHAEQYDELACTSAMDSLVEIEAVEALPVIRHAFALDKIDPMVRGDWGDILDQLGADTEPDDSLIAISQQRAEERRERFFPSSLRRQLNAALGNEPESAFAQLMREHGPPSGPPAGSPVSETALQQAEAQARKERQRRAEAQTRKEKQKRKAAATARKANRKKHK